MPLKIDGAERRMISLEVELPGTVEQVWRAIATGPGISAWFVPSTVEEREGGIVAFQLGPDMTSTGEVTAFEAPRRFAYVEKGWSGDAPPLGTEFVIEALSGSTCRLRLVHSLFTDADDWDKELGSMETGWPPFFGVLAIYLKHFADQPVGSIRPDGTFAGTEAEAWAALTTKLGLAGATPGERRKAPADGAPPLAGTVVRVDEGAHHQVTLLLDSPAPGVALVGTYQWGGVVKAAVSLFFYGVGGSAEAERQQPIWTAWMAENFRASA